MRPDTHSSSSLMSSDTTRQRTRERASRPWSAFSIAAVVFAIVSTAVAVAQPSPVSLTGSINRNISDTIGTPGSGPVAPAFIEHPLDVSTTAFVDAGFIVAYRGRPMPAVSWQFSADGANWNDVPGATTPALIVRSPVVAHDGTHWRARLDAPGTTPLFSNAATLSVAKAAADIRVDGLVQIHDGTPKRVVVSTMPAGLGYTVSYTRDGSVVAQPIDPGSYSVVVEVSGSNHAGSAAATMVIKSE